MIKIGPFSIRSTMPLRGHWNPVKEFDKLRRFEDVAVMSPQSIKIDRVNFQLRSLRQNVLIESTL